METCKWCGKYIRALSQVQYENGHEYHLDCFHTREHLKEKTGRLFESEAEAEAQDAVAALLSLS